MIPDAVEGASPNPIEVRWHADACRASTVSLRSSTARRRGLSLKDAVSDTLRRGLRAMAEGDDKPGATFVTKSVDPGLPRAIGSRRPPSTSIFASVRSAGSVSSHVELAAPSKTASACHGTVHGTTRSCRQMASAFLLLWRTKPAEPSYKSLALISRIGHRANDGEDPAVE
jgi:hypothetical protein